MQSSYDITSITENLEDHSLQAQNEGILPKDSVTASAWNPQSELQFGVTSFDGSFRLYQIVSSKQSAHFGLAAIFKYHLPLTHFVFIDKTSYVAIGGCDGKILIVDLNGSRTGEIAEYRELGEHARHKSHIQKLFFDSSRQVLVSVDTERTVKIWDFRKSILLDSVETKSEILACDFVFPLLFLSLSSRKITILNITQTHQ